MTFFHSKFLALPFLICAAFVTSTPFFGVALVVCVLVVLVVCLRFFELSPGFYGAFRLGMATLLQIPIGYFILDWLYGQRRQGHSYFPTHAFLFEAAVSVVALIVLLPILMRGDRFQRAVAGLLTLMPMVLFGTAVYWIIKIFRWAYAAP